MFYSIVEMDFSIFNTFILAFSLESHHWTISKKFEHNLQPIYLEHLS